MIMMVRVNLFLYQMKAYKNRDGSKRKRGRERKREQIKGERD
jgi:hypothetical protein